jgi:hypothetical protein
MSFVEPYFRGDQNLVMVRRTESETQIEFQKMDVRCSRIRVSVSKWETQTVIGITAIPVGPIHVQIK